MKKNNTKYLAKYEADMITSLFYSYVRQLPSSVLMEIDKIYTDETGKSLNTNFYCSGCILKLFKNIAYLYFKENLDRLEPDLQEKFKSRYKA